MILVLLPVRNATHVLSGCFQSVRKFADTVLALEDGSTDGVPKFSRHERLDRGILPNPPCNSLAELNDTARCSRPLATSVGFDSDRMPSFDADEPIDALDEKSW